MKGFEGCEDLGRLEREQLRIAALEPDPWIPSSEPLLVAGLFIAFARGEQGPGRAGDTAVVGVAVTVEVPGSSTVANRSIETLEMIHVSGQAPAPYAPGFLAAREGALLLQGLESLSESGIIPDVVLVDATGRDHPRRAGVAVHLGAVSGLPTVGVTHRPLRARGVPPGPEPGAWSDLRLDGVTVGRWVRTSPGARPLAVHAGWRTDAETAYQVVMRSLVGFRTPEPLRIARMVAREARAAWLD